VGMPLRWRGWETGFREHGHAGRRCAEPERPRCASLLAMVHIALHFVVPLVVAFALYRRRPWRSFLILLATLVVDLDHLLAHPIYDPERCSIHFHPLHTTPAIVVYGLVFAFPLLWRRWSAAQVVHLVGLGLLIHMALDWVDCLV
jgi:hypothetical protein